MPKQHSGKPEKKTSVERMIEDFHRSLPHPGAAKEPDGRSTAASTVVSKRTGALVAAAAGPNSNGTMTSQMSNWSAGSSVASFDYHQVRNIGSRCLQITVLREFRVLATSGHVRGIHASTSRGERVHLVSIQG